MNSEFRIELKYNQLNSVISGRPTGLECYEEQMKKIIEENIDTIGVKFVIVFPENIKLVSGSSLLGMFEKINNLVGLDGIKDKFEFISSTGDNLKEILINELKRSGC